MINKTSTILFLAPHTDDIEFGCGGTISKFSEITEKIYCVAFSAAEESVPKNLNRNINRKNMYESLDILGVKKENISILSFPVRKFPEFRQKILDELILLKQKINPDFVFLPSTFDTHQDHQVVRNEGFRIFKTTTLLGYEIPWNNLTFTTNLFVGLSQKNVKLKIDSIKTYISQLGRKYVDEEFIKSILITRGGQIGTKYAESFEIIRWILK